MNMTYDGSGSEISTDRLLAVAKETMAHVKNCWLITINQSGAPSARVVEPIPGVPGEKAWTVWVLTSSISRKVADIGLDSRVTLGYQYDPDSAYVSLAGRATIIDEKSEISRRWQESWNRVFEAGAEDPDAVFLRVDVDRIELFSLAQKIAPAPFCKRSAALVRNTSGQWSEA